MIPKIIHYCWFGRNPLPPLALKCIDSWRRYCLGYEIKEWNEDNFDIHCCKYAEEAYTAKKWAFVSDVARLHVLVNEGGIYMDTDVEALKPLDNLLYYEAFSGFESETQIPTGIMGARKGHPLLNEFLTDYIGTCFIDKNGTYNTETNVIRITRHCLRYGLMPNNTLQTINGFTLFPKDYFCPKDWATGRITLTENSYTIHHFDGSWLSKSQKMKKILRYIVGESGWETLLKIRLTLKSFKKSSITRRF